MKRKTMLVVESVLGLILSVYLIGPVLVLLWASLQDENGLTFRFYQTFFETASCWQALWGSVRISLATVLAGMLIGIPLAVLVHRIDFPGRSFFASTLILPLALPPLVGTLVFYYLFSDTGVFPRAMEALTGISAANFAARQFWGVLLVHTYTMYPFVYVMTLASLQRMDDSLLEAARSLGAGRWRTMTAVWFPLLSPALIGSSLLVFMTSMASFSAPYFFDNSGPYLSVLIYRTKINDSWGLAMAQAVVLSMVSVVFLILLQRYRGVESVRSASKGVARPPRPIPFGWRRTVAGICVAIASFFLLLPDLFIVILSFVKRNSWTVQILPTQFTLNNYRELIFEPYTWRPVANSIAMALGVTTVLAVLGLGVAACIARKDLPYRKTLDLIAMLPWALPGTVLALQLIVFFRSPSPLAMGQALVGTIWILPIAYAMRMLPIVVRSTTAAFQHYDPTLSEAAAGLGAKPWNIFHQVVLPLIAPGWIAGLLLVFVTTLGEFPSSILLYVYNNTPISVRIDQQRIDVGAIFVYGVILVGCAVIAAGVSRQLTGKNRNLSI